MKKRIALLLAAALCLSLTACGASTAEEVPETTAPVVETEPVIETTAPTETEPAVETTAPVETEAVEETPVAETETVEEDTISLNAENIETETFSMTFDSLRIVDEYFYSAGGYTMELPVEDGYKLLVLEGHAENTGTSTISAYAFLRTAVVNGEYVINDPADTLMRFIRGPG